MHFSASPQEKSKYSRVPLELYSNGIGVLSLFGGQLRAATIEVTSWGRELYPNLAMAWKMSGEQ